MAHDDPEESEVSRLTAHRMLDLLSLWDDEAQSLSRTGFETIMVELGEIGAVYALVDDDKTEGERITVNIGPILNATGFLLGMLVQLTADRSDLDRLTVVSMLRDQIETSHGNDGGPATT